MSKINRFFINIVFIVLFTACTDKQYVDFTDSSELIHTSIQLNVDDVLAGYNRAFDQISDQCDFFNEYDISAGPVVDTQTILQRRGVIYQFNKDGSFLHKTDPFLVQISYGTPSVINAKLKPGTNQNLYLFVVDELSDIPDIHRESEMINLVFEKGGIRDEDNFPFWGKQTNVDLVSDSQHTLRTFQLERVCSKLIVDYEIDPASGFLLQDVRIVNAPNSVLYLQGNGIGSKSYSSVIRSVSSPKGNMTFFIPENIQGVVSQIQDPEDKNIRRAPTNATYVELIGYYKSKKVIFRIYPGANSTSDFNLIRNHWYRIFFKVTDVYLDDLRVESSSLDEFVIYLTDEPGRNYSDIKNILLNNELWINDFEIQESKIILNYTSTPDSYLHEIAFCDDAGNKIFGGKTGYYFSYYSSMFFSSLLEAQGNGSESAPYQIFEPKQLKNISKLCNSGFQNRLYVQQSDLDMYYLDRYNWKPIGSKSHPFIGIYDGNGYSIRNLSINTEALGTNYLVIPTAGLFGYTEYAYLKNIHLRDGAIGCKSDFMGSLAGHVNHSRIEDCSTTLKIEQFQPSIAGGIVGKLENSELQNCYNKSNKGMTAWGAVTYYTGGIVGFAINSQISSVYSVQSIWIGNYYALGAVIGGMDAASLAMNYYAELYKTTGNKTIGAPDSDKGFLSGSELKSSGFVDKLNQSDQNNIKWKYQAGDYPKLYNER